MIASLVHNITPDTILIIAIVLVFLWIERTWNAIVRGPLTVLMTVLGTTGAITLLFFQAHSWGALSAIALGFGFGLMHFSSPEGLPHIRKSHGRRLWRLNGETFNAMVTFIGMLTCFFIAGLLLSQ